MREEALPDAALGGILFLHLLVESLYGLEGGGKVQ